MFRLAYVFASIFTPAHCLRRAKTTTAKVCLTQLWAKSFDVVLHVAEQSWRDNGLQRFVCSVHACLNRACVYIGAGRRLQLTHLLSQPKLLLYGVVPSSARTQTTSLLAFGLLRDGYQYAAACGEAVSWGTRRDKFDPPPRRDT